jgi:diguanylate cyclase (GGDEF)-like protein/PAS domain S-box-containing protein
MGRDKAGVDAGEALQRLPLRVALLILLCAMGTLLTLLILETQAGVTAYIVGEGHWSRAQQRSVHALYRYAAHGDPLDLAEARRALDVPLGDRAARLALDRSPVDMAAARAGLQRGNIRPRDVDRMIWMYRMLSGAPYFRQSVGHWLRGDAEILRLAALADELEARLASGPLDAASVRAYQDEVVAIDARLRPIELAFSQSLADGGDLIRRCLLLLGVAAFLTLALYALWVMRSTLLRVRETESGFRSAFHQSAVGMAKLDREGRFVQANEALARLLDMPLPRLRASRLDEVMLEEDLPRDDSGGLDWSWLLESGERRIIAADGRVCWVRWTASRVAAHGPGSDLVFVLVEDVSEARALVSEMAHQASHDELTGLVNRREIGRRLARLLDRTRSRGGEHALCYIDLDRFKLVNDTCGHEAGDRYLRQFVATVQARLRQHDWMGRLGGDEFAVLLLDTNLEQAEAVMTRVYAELSATTFEWGGRAFDLACSTGVVEINAATADVDWLLRAADTACYVAKEEGRNRVRCYRESDQTLASRRRELDWVARVRLAIAERRLLLYAQRIEALDGQASLQYEVLVRLRESDGRVVEPGAFLPAVERYGQAMLVDRYVVDAVAALLAANPAHLERLELCHVNVSAQSVVDPSFLDHLGRLLDRYPALAAKLCFEITETAVIGNMDDAGRFIRAMRARGCRIALDDLGSGMSSFGYLKRLDVDILKIDGGFVRDMANGEADIAIVRSMSQVGKALGKDTIAEWVDSDATARRLALLGVRRGQGFGIHVPCPVEELIADDAATPRTSVALAAAAGAWSSIMAP